MKTDTELKQDVIAELNWEPTVIEGVITPSDNPKIGVSVMDGVVTLDGEVDSYSKKWAASRAAGQVVLKQAHTNLSGFKMPFGSKARFTTRCNARASRETASGHQRFLARPIPCSPVITPPQAMT